MNADGRKKLKEAHDLLNQAKDIIDTIANEEQEKFDNLSEGLQQAESGQKMEETAATLTDVVSNLEDQMSAIDEV